MGRPPLPLASIASGVTKTCNCGIRYRINLPAGSLPQKQQRPRHSKGLCCFYGLDYLSRDSCFPFVAVACPASCALNLFRSWAVLWQSPHLGNCASMAAGCGVPWQSWHFGIIRCCDWWQAAQASSLCLNGLAASNAAAAL